MMELQIHEICGALVAATFGRGGVIELAADPLSRPDRRDAIFRARVIRREAGHTILDIGGEEALARTAIEAGERLLVQLRQEARDGKRAEASPEILLAGEYLVRVHGGTDLGVSSRIPDRPAARRRAVALGLGEGWILRRFFADAEDEDVLAEAAALSATTAGLAADGPLGEVLAAAPVWARLLRDSRAIDRIRLPVALFDRLRRSLPGDIAIEKGQTDLPELVERLLQPEVPLPRGGRLTIETTRALTAIDVDSGANAPAAANIAAAREIPRQIRLRNIGGLIAIDLVSTRKGGEEVLAALRQGFRDDPAHVRITPRISPLGLVELARERRGPSLAEALRT